MNMDSKGRILIVDDNAINVAILRRILRKEYSLETAANGEECLEKTPIFKPHLVLLDILLREQAQEIESHASEARADAALYASKKAGRNCIHWHDGNESHPVTDAAESAPKPNTPPRWNPLEETLPCRV